MTSVKICGLKRPEHIAVAANAGARYVGFVFFPKSTRNVSVADAVPLAQSVPVGVAKVALVVNPTNELLDQIIADVPIDMIQLHGAEDAARIAEVKTRYGLPVMKAVGIANREDVKKAVALGGVADQLLLDAKPDPNALLPGGNGHAFDWSLVRDQKWLRPWMLAGGLDADNVTEAVRMTHATQVDVSSGVESSAGVKDATMIAAFIAAAQAVK